MKMSKEQINKANAAMGNNFKLDLWALLVRGEKQAEKRIYLNEEKSEYVRATVSFSESYNRYEKSLEIYLNISKWTVENEAAHSFGMGLSHRIPYGKTRKNYADIWKITHQITDEMIMDYYNGNRAAIENPVILDAMGWHVNNI